MGGRSNYKNIKKSHDSWWTNVFAARIAIRIVNVLKVSNITPNEITLISFTIALIASLCFVKGSWAFLVAGGVLIQISFILDCVDGQLARTKGLSSERGAWLDLTTDVIKVFAIYFSLSIGASENIENGSVWYLGFTAYFLSVSSMFLYYARPRRLIDEDEILHNAEINGLCTDRIYKIIRKHAYFLSFSLPDQYLVISIFTIFGSVGILLRVIVIWGGAALIFSIVRTWGRMNKAKYMKGL